MGGLLPRFASYFTRHSSITTDSTNKDVPSVAVTVDGDSTVVFGSDITFTGTIASSLTVTSVTWQKGDGSQININISNPKYAGSSFNFGSPKLVVNDVNFSDGAVYQLVVTNLAGTGMSNKINLTVIEDLDFIDLTGNENKLKEKIEEICENKIKLHLGRDQDSSRPWLMSCNAKFQKTENKIDVTGTIQERLPNTQLPGMVILIVQKGPYDYKPYYPDTRIKYITCVDSDFRNACRLRMSLKGFISKDWSRLDRNEYDHKKEPLSITGRDKTEGGKAIVSVDSPVDSPDKLDMVEQCLLKFMHTNFPESSSSVHKYSSTESNPYQFLFKIGESILCVVHLFEEMNSYAIKVCGNQNVGRQVHIIVDENGINDTLIINTQALSDIKRFLYENPSDEIDVIAPVQQMHYDSAKAYVFLESFLLVEMKGVKVNFLQAENIPTHPWIFVCYAFDENDKFLKLKETLKGYGSMLLKVHGYQNIPKEAKIRNMANDGNKTTIHLLMENYEIDDRLYMNHCAKAELQRTFEHSSIGNIAGNTVQEEKLESKGVPFQHRKRIYIKCIANLPKKAFTNFTERYITRIEPIWITGEDPIEEGSICIVVCFNFSRLQDDIAAVVRVTPQGCKNMLVVIKNCQEGISPGPMLNSYLGDEFIAFTNILYNDGECYDCHMNSLARVKVQAFIDNN